MMYTANFLSYRKIGTSVMEQIFTTDLNLPSESINMTTPNNVGGGKEPHDEKKRDNASTQPLMEQPVNPTTLHLAHLKAKSRTLTRRRTRPQRHEL
jgi:hypothetical protein